MADAMKCATTNAAPTVKTNAGIVTAKPGPCLWCGRYVTIGRKEAGATNPLDPCWNDDGDFGCASSPWTDAEGTGDHARPFDLAVRIAAEQEEERRSLPSTVRA